MKRQPRTVYMTMPSDGGDERQVAVYATVSDLYEAYTDDGTEVRRLTRDQFVRAVEDGVGVEEMGAVFCKKEVLP